MNTLDFNKTTQMIGSKQLEKKKKIKIHLIREFVHRRYEERGSHKTAAIKDKEPKTLNTSPNETKRQRWLQFGLQI